MALETFDGILCISGTELICSDENPDGFISEMNFKNLRSRKRINVRRRGCYGIPSLTAVDSLPVDIRNQVYARYPDYHEQAKAKPFIDEIVTDGTAINFFAEFILPDGRHLSADKQSEYCNNAAILNAFKSKLEKAASHRRRQSATKLSKTTFWKSAAEALPRISDRWPHSLPDNSRRLQERFNAYQKYGYESLISKKFLNNNAAKVDDDVKESILTELLSDSRNLDNEQIMSLYNMMAERLNWKKITRQTIAVWRDKVELVSYAGRRGGNAFRNTKTMQVKRSKPTMPLLYWTMDGWDAELLFQRTITDRNGRSVTTYHNRLTVVVVLDPCINYPVGYSIGDHECPELIKEALRNASNHTAELFGQRYRTNQLQCDNYSIKTMTPLYNVVSDKLTPARVGNAKSKVVEPYFLRINKKYCQMMPNWSGFGVTSNKDSQPNPDMLNKYRHSFPTEEGCREQIARIMEMERQSKVERYLTMFNDVPEDKRLPLTPQQYLLNFGADTGVKNSICGCGLLPTINGIKRSYDCFDPSFRNYAHIRWTIKYDPNDLSTILAVNDDCSLQYMLTEKYVQPMALAERKEGDSKALQAVRDFNVMLEAHVTEQRAIAGSKMKELFESRPELNDTLAKMVLVDSRGQHKDERNSVRRKSVAAHIDIKEIDVQVVKKDTPKSEDTNLYELY